MHLRRLSAALALPLLLACLPASSAEAAERTVKAGGEVFLMAFYRYKSRDCTSMKPAVKVVKAPSHGSLHQKIGFRDPYNATATSSWGARCTGHRIRALEFSYRPNRGFRGKDRVSLRQIGFESEPVLHFDIVVE